MKLKAKFMFYVFVILMLAHLILVAGCGSNPLLGILYNSITVEVMKL